MKLQIASLGILVLLGSSLIAEEPEQTERLSTFMRHKLSHSGEILEGLTTENLEQVARNAQALSLLSLESQWKVFQTPEYNRRSIEFRREVDALRAAAKDGNLDGATLYYVKATMSCVECHKYVRNTPLPR